MAIWFNSRIVCIIKRLYSAFRVLSSGHVSLIVGGVFIVVLVKSKISNLCKGFTECVLMYHISRKEFYYCSAYGVGCSSSSRRVFSDRYISSKPAR
jgi:hypothetical protein